MEVEKHDTLTFRVQVIEPDMVIQVIREHQESGLYLAGGKVTGIYKRDLPTCAVEIEEVAGKIKKAVREIKGPETRTWEEAEFRLNDIWALADKIEALATGPYAINSEKHQDAEATDEPERESGPLPGPANHPKPSQDVADVCQPSGPDEPAALVRILGRRLTELDELKETVHRQGEILQQAVADITSAFKKMSTLLRQEEFRYWKADVSTAFGRLWDRVTKLTTETDHLAKGTASSLSDLNQGRQRLERRVSDLAAGTVSSLSDINQGRQRLGREVYDLQRAVAAQRLRREVYDLQRAVAANTKRIDELFAHVDSPIEIPKQYPAEFVFPDRVQSHRYKSEKESTPDDTPATPAASITPGIAPDPCPACGHTEIRVQYTAPLRFRCERCNCVWMKEARLPVQGEVRAQEARLPMHGEARMERMIIHLPDIGDKRPDEWVSACPVCRACNYRIILNSDNDVAKFICRECDTTWSR